MKNTFLLSVSLLLLIISCKKRDENTEKTYKIFDVHLHSDWWGEANKVAFTRKEYIGQKDEKSYIDSTIFYLKKYNFVKAVTDGSNANELSRQLPNTIIPAIFVPSESPFFTGL